MGTLNDLISLALNEVGVCEQPLGSNIVKYNDAFWPDTYRADGASYPWCCCFVWWIFQQIEGFDKLMCNSAHCNSVKRLADDLGRWVTKDYRVGDLVLYNYDGDQDYDHIGIIVSVDGNGKYTTVEGNYNNRVSKVTRKGTEFAGAYRPDYGGEENGNAESDNPVDSADLVPCDVSVTLPHLMQGDSGTAVELMQFLLMVNGFLPDNSLRKSGRMDGEYGYGTNYSLYRFQQELKIEENGCGALTWAALLKGGSE